MIIRHSQASVNYFFLAHKWDTFSDDNSLLDEITKTGVIVGTSSDASDGQSGRTSHGIPPAKLSPALRAYRNKADYISSAIPAESSGSPKPR